MLSIQAVCGLPRVRAPGIVHCIISFSRNSLVSSWCNHSMLASLLWQCLTAPFYSSFVKNPLICFVCSPRNRRIFYPFHLKGVKTCFFILSECHSSFHSRTLLQATSAFISGIFDEISMLWLCHIFCSDAPIACPLFNLVRNSVVHSPSFVTRNPTYGNIHLLQLLIMNEYAHAMPLLVITLVLSMMISRLYLRLTRSRRFTNSCSCMTP